MRRARGRARVVKEPNIQLSMPMPKETHSCTQCGASTQSNAGICINCFLREGLKDVSEDNSAEVFARMLREDDIPEKSWRLGNYEILRELGRGGMGVVLLARRADEQYEKHVAIKVIKRGMDSDAVLRHFRDERQILAGFDHPNIARLFDAGTTTDGLPYFVMERVEGLPINEYCANHQLNLNERLKLFREVCAAVSYAHRHLVVHRDLKPSNIVVTAEGVPKLLDFGIAKVLQQGSGDQPLVTMTGMRLLTPEYASPEQVRGQPVTTASDVYSLGVVLYQLLTGQLPYRLATRSRHELEKAVTEQAPTRPSTAVRDSKNAPSRSGIRSGVASHFSLDDSGALRGDIDTIVLMALRKEPERRYQSVEQLSEDIRRYLESRPVLARRDTVGYRTAKFVRRNAVATAVAVLLVLSLIGGIIATASQARKARAQEALAKSEKSLAERRFNDVRRLAHSVLFDYHDAIKDLPGATRVRERLVKDALAYLDNLSRETNGDLDLQRELAAAYEKVGDVLGQEYGANLGDRAGALNSYEKALKIREGIASSARRDTQNRRGIAALNKKMGDALASTDEADRGLEQLRRAAAILSDLVTEQPKDVQVRRDLAGVFNNLGLALEDRNQLAEALEYHRKALALRTQLLVVDPKSRLDRRGLSVSYENIGRVLALNGNLKSALENNGQAMTLRRELLAEDPENAEYRRILSISYQNNGDYLALAKDNAGAIDSFRKKLELDEKSYAADRDNAQARGDLAYATLRLGELLAEAENYREASLHYERSAHLSKENMKADSRDLSLPLGAASAEAGAAQAQAKMGNVTKAAKQCEEARTLLEAAPVDPNNISQHSVRSHAYRKVGDAYVAVSDHESNSDEARRMARTCYDRAFAILKDDYDRGRLNADDEAELKELAAKLAIPATGGQVAK